MPKQIILTADDFGLSVAVNEAVEQAHRQGMLTAASLMVAGEAAEDAVRRARAMPALRVGLHLVLVEGRAVLPHSAIPDLADRQGWLGSDQWQRGLSCFF
ncbi:MAG: ChbG/HpnK family deacetylase, partial [Acetobacteraceae bacterium]